MVRKAINVNKMLPELHEIVARSTPDIIFITVPYLLVNYVRIKIYIAVTS